MSRLVKWVTALCCLLIIGAASANAQRAFEGRTVVIRDSGGALAAASKQAYWTPFEEATGAKIVVVETDLDTAVAAVKAQVQAGKPEWDAMASIDASLIPRLAGEGLLEPIDHSKIPGAGQLKGAAKTEFGIAMFNAAVAVAYRETGQVKPLNSVSDYFNPDNKAPRAAGGTAGHAQAMCMLALIADGVDVQTIKSIDIDRCLNVWKKVKDQVSVWWTTGSETVQAMVDHQVDYMIGYDGRLIQAAKTDPSWHIVHKGGISFYAYLTYVKGTKNADVLNALADFMLDPKRQAKFTELAGYSAPNPDAIQYLPDNLKPFLSTSPEALAGLTNIPAELSITLKAQDAEVGKAWFRWLSE